MNRRHLVTTGLGGVASTLITSGTAGADSIRTQAGYRSQYVLVQSGGYSCPEPSYPVPTYEAQILIWANDDRAWRLGTSPGQLLISVPFWDPYETTIVDEVSDDGFNYDGVRFRNHGWFGVRVPCRRKYRKELKVGVDVVFLNAATGRRLVFNGVGYPGRWMWLRKKSTRPYTPVCHPF